MVSSVIGSCTLHTGIREGQLQKALQKVHPKLPTAASLAAATAAAEAAKQRALQRALPKLASSASLATSTPIEEESQQPSATIQAEAAPAGASDAPEDMAATAPAGHSVAAPTPASAVNGPSPMDIDTAPAQDSRSAQVPGLQPESSSLTAADPTAVANSEEGQKAETSKQAVEQVPASELERSVTLSNDVQLAISMGTNDASVASMTQALYICNLQVYLSQSLPSALTCTCATAHMRQ